MQTIQTLLSEKPVLKRQKKEFDKDFFCEFAAGVMLRLHTNKSQDFKYVIDEDNEKVIHLLWDYFFNPEHFDLQYNPKYYSGKGILLMGAPGSGKTNLMEIFIALCKYFFKEDTKNHFKKRSMRQILASYKKGEVPVISQIHNYFFDEIGLSEARNYKSFGNGTDIDANVIETRHESFRYGYITHYTTNLSKKMMTGIDKDGKEMPEFANLKFDQRVVSRLRECCNIISLNGKDRRLHATPKRYSPPPKVDKQTLIEVAEKARLEEIKKAKEEKSEVNPFLLEVWFDTARKHNLFEIDTSLQWEELLKSRKTILERYALGLSKKKLKNKEIQEDLEVFRENHKLKIKIENNSFERDAIRETKANYFKKYYLEA